jgi:formamidopyrimidine-DNA glycosylase
MPELPEVETVVRDLRRAGIGGRTFRKIEVFWHRSVAPLTPAQFIARLQDQSVTAIERRAKFIILHLSGGSDLLVHLRMTGQFHWATSDTPPTSHDRIVLTLDDGRRLCYSDTRKFGRWLIVPNAQAHLAHLGPEPLLRSFSLAVFSERLARFKRRLKPLLLDQRCVAGLGNIYVDEALWTAHLHPERLSQSLSAPEIRALHAAIRSVLRQGVRNRGTSLGDGKTNYNRLDGQRGRNQGILNVFRRTHAPCPACATPIQRMLVGQRSTHFCPHCQPEMHGSQGRSPSNRCQPEMHGSQGRSPSKKRISANRGVSTGGRASLRAVGKTR